MQGSTIGIGVTSKSFVKRLSSSVLTTFKVSPGILERPRVPKI